MGAEHEAVRARLGSVGVWTFAFDQLPAAQVRAAAAAIESLGYPALWVPEGGGSRDVFAHLSLLLSSTERITVCSGIANVTARHAETMREGAVTLADAFGERVVLGVGIGHQSTSARRGQEWARPLDRMRAYLDLMDEPPGSAGPAVPVRRLLAALGDGMLGLAAERALGAHTYFVPVEHTAHARAQLGPVPVLAVEQTAVLTSDASHAREIARGWVADYLELPNYLNNWRRLGYEEGDLAGRASDRLIDAGIAWGSVGDVVARVRAQLDAGADHVCVQVIGEPGAGVQLLRELAPALLEIAKP
jgi:probable F420-dependent oxidoreductase